MRALTPLRAAAVFAVGAAVLLTGCGGSSGSSGAIKGAESGAGSPAPSASGSAGPAVERPSVAFPAGAKNVFEGAHTGDPKKDAVLADSADGIDSVDQAILTGRARTAALTFYETGQALASAGSYIHGYLSRHQTWVGTTRYFDRQVTFAGGDSASVVYCSDESRSFLKDRESGKVDDTPTSAQSYVLYNTRLTKDAEGVWQTVDVISQRGAKQCQP